ncbi:SapB/AmfS family lanthipeptide [Nonomuraea sp. NPDC046802]
MSFVLNLQVKDVREDHGGGDPGEPFTLSLLSPVSCYSTTSIALC